MSDEDVADSSTAVEGVDRCLMENGKTTCPNLTEPVQNSCMTTTLGCGKGLKEEGENDGVKDDMVVKDEAMVEATGEVLKEVSVEGEEKSEAGVKVRCEDDKGAVEGVGVCEVKKRCAKPVGTGQCESMGEIGQEFCVNHKVRVYVRRSKKDDKEAVMLEVKSEVGQAKSEKVVKNEDKEENSEVALSFMDQDENLCKRESRRKRKSSQEGEEETVAVVDGVEKARAGSHSFRERKTKPVPKQSTIRRTRARTQMRDDRKPQTKRDAKYYEEISENCHQCQRHDKGGVIRCMNCKMKRYCISCVKW